MRNIKKIELDLTKYRTDFLAKHFAVTEASICNWKNEGKIPLKYAQKVADLLTFKDKKEKKGEENVQKT